MASQRERWQFLYVGGAVVGWQYHRLTVAEARVILANCFIRTEPRRRASCTLGRLIQTMQPTAAAAASGVVAVIAATTTSAAAAGTGAAAAFTATATVVVVVDDDDATAAASSLAVRRTLPSTLTNVSVMTQLS